MATDYTKLTRDIVTAIEASHQAASASDDGGTCNLDNVMIRIPRANQDKVNAAAQAAGSSTSKSSSGWNAGAFYLSVPVYGQANRRTRGVEAAAKSLKANGWQAFVSYITD